MTKLFNRTETKNIRRVLREQYVSAERKLWYRIRKKQLGYRFNRQYGIAQYIVDFYCAKKKLIIEVDGATHGTEKEIANDLVRERYLKNLGCIIKRYTNIEIFENIDIVIDDIYNELNK